MQDKNAHVQKIAKNEFLIQLPQEVRTEDKTLSGKPLSLSKSGNEFTLTYYNSDGMLSAKTWTIPFAPVQQGQVAPPRFLLFGNLPPEE